MVDLKIIIKHYIMFVKFYLASKKSNHYNYSNSG